ncbi:hypothetical protein DL93DRAFT_33574 [Clavulina sp. PMI_390]|nr:hypothetical protein DL93DRAFT_33574 [Clavulina sp. PMI_390]
MSSDLTWLLVKKWNAFQVRGVPEGPVFSKEPGNLRNIHANKYSALSNPKFVGIDNKKGSIVLTTRKSGASSQQVKSGVQTTTLRRGGSRHHAGKLATHASNGYRADLRRSALARISALHAAKHGPKVRKNQKKTRSEKRAEAASA